MSNPFYLEFKSGIAFRAVFLTASHPSLSVDLPNNLALSKDHTNNWAIEEKVDQKTSRHILKYRDSNQDHDPGCTQVSTPQLEEPPIPI